MVVIQSGVPPPSSVGAPSELPLKERRITDVGHGIVSMMMLPLGRSRDMLPSIALGVRRS